MKNKKTLLCAVVGLGISCALALGLSYLCCPSGVKPHDEIRGRVHVYEAPKVENMRDLGGWETLDGRRVRSGRVFRSAALNGSHKRWFRSRWNLPEISKTYLTQVLGIKTDVDLRSDLECEGMTGSPLGESVAWRHIPSQAYTKLATQEGRAAFSQVFRVFLDERNYPILFHCRAGRDRAGAVAFILNALLGVSEEDLIYDWEYSMRSRNSTDFDYGKIQNLVDVFALYPGVTLKERVESYVKSLGFSDEDLGKFRSLMLE